MLYFLAHTRTVWLPAVRPVIVVEAEVPLVVEKVTQLPLSTWYCQLSQFTLEDAERLMLEALAADADMLTVGALRSIFGSATVALVPPLHSQLPLVLEAQKMLKSLFPLLARSWIVNEPLPLESWLTVKADGIVLLPSVYSVYCACTLQPSTVPALL